MKVHVEGSKAQPNKWVNFRKMYYLLLVSVFLVLFSMVVSNKHIYEYNTETI